MEETYVRSLIRDDPTCDGTTKPSSHNYWTSALGPWSCNYWSLSTLDPVLHHKRSLCKWDTHTLQWRVASARFNWRKPVKQQKPSTAKNKYIVFSFFFFFLIAWGKWRDRERGTEEILCEPCHVKLEKPEIIRAQIVIRQHLWALILQ